MTVAEQVVYVSQILADTSNKKWTSTTHIVPALNSAQEEFVIKILAFKQQAKQAINALSELEETVTSNISTSGYAMSGVDASAPFMRNGLIAVNCTLDGKSRWGQIIYPSDLRQQQNQYLKGNDERPLAYEYNEKVYVLASTGSYPVASVIYYIRELKVLISSGASGYQATTCELNAVYHRLIAEIAAANCWRMLGDESSITKYDKIMARIEPRIQSIVVSGTKNEEGK